MSLTLVFPAAVYSLETIKKAAYRLSGVISVDIVPRSEDIECTLDIPPGLGDVEEQRLVAAFKNEVLDQDLRSIISKETQSTRNAILAFALSKTGLQGIE